jgi:crotonobetainyl-CoA:carnitine CoA-transferase CaiB-like acyl-CoA transferase
VRLGRVAHVRHPELGLVREFARLVRIEDAAVPPHRLAPGLGEHTAEILAQFGVGDAEIAAMRAREEIR